MGRTSGHNSLEQIETAIHQGKESPPRCNKVLPALSVSSAEASAPLTALNSCCIMNLENLSTHLQLITTHAASFCGSYTVEEETYRVGLASVTVPFLFHPLHVLLQARRRNFGQSIFVQCLVRCQQHHTCNR